MDNGEFFTKTRLSESVGWSESGGRRWIDRFKNYIPFTNIDGRKMYTLESQRKLAILKRLSDIELNMKEVEQLIKEEGFPEDEEAIVAIEEKYKNLIQKANYKKNIADTIPSTKDILLPFLRIISDGRAYLASQVTEKLVSYFNLNESQRTMRYESNSDSIFLSRVRGARYSLKQEEYINEVSKLTYQITELGLNLLKDDEKEVIEEVEELDKVIDPLSLIRTNIEELNEQLSNDLLKHLIQVHWMRFEDIVVELLTAMGYGDGKVTQRTNDEGLDGIIKEDKLGLENIYIQAKKYAIENSIGRNDVQSFSGALDAKGARKGVFITTSYFTTGAIKYAEKLESKRIILIDGKELTKLMIAYDVGVEEREIFIIKEVDYDYFKED